MRAGEFQYALRSNERRKGRITASEKRRKLIGGPPNRPVPRVAIGSITCSKRGYTYLPGLRLNSAVGSHVGRVVAFATAIATRIIIRASCTIPSYVKSGEYSSEG